MCFLLQLSLIFVVMITLSIYKANELDKNAKVSVQSSGKLGFSEGAAKKLNLSGNEFFILAANNEDATDENLYGWIEPNGDSGGFKVNKSGNYFNINTKPLFDKLGIDYRDKNTTIIYDIVDFDNGGNKICKLIKRVQKRNTRKQE